MNVIFRISLIVFIYKLGTVSASLGDQLDDFRECAYSCVQEECEIDGYSYMKDDGFTLSSLVQWPCFDECKYNCMWATVDKLEENNRPIPQFYGKWPFVRIFGIQEPASAIFSFLNLLIHLKWVIIFRHEVPSSAPLYWLWHVFAGVCLHAWFWSMLFHTKDTPLTEFMDYAGAFSIILVNCYVAVTRTARMLGKLYSMFVTLFFILFYINHVLYLYSTHRIDYKYNLTLNFSIGIFTVIIWLLWCFWNRNTQPYVKKCAIYVILTSLVALLEIIDKPPLFYVFDSHSIWHLSTAFLIGLFYRFAISDCRYLRVKLVEKDYDLKKNL